MTRESKICQSKGSNTRLQYAACAGGPYHLKSVLSLGCWAASLVLYSSLYKLQLPLNIVK